MRPPRSPRSRVVVIAAVAVAVVVGSLGAWQVSAARDSQRNQILDDELTVSHLASSALGSGLSTRLQLVSNLASQNGMAKVIASSSRPRLERLVSTLRVLYPEFSSLAIDSASGRLLAVSPADVAPIGKIVRDKPAYSGAVRTRKPYVSRSSNLAGVGLVVSLAAPSYSGGHLAGVIVTTIPVARFGSILGSVQLRSGGSIVVVDQDARALTGPARGSSVRFTSLPAVSLALHGKTGTSEDSVPGFNGSRLVAYTPVDPFGWAVLVEQPVSTLNGPIGTLTLHLALIEALVVLIAVATAIFLTRLLSQLSKERDESSAVLASVGEGVATIDPSGKLIRINPALEKLSGLDARSATGAQWIEVFRFEDERGHRVSWPASVVARSISERRVVASHGFSRTMITADGTRVPVAITAAPLTAKDGQVAGAVTVIRDISREREVDELKSSLVSTVSHELRTPLTMIRGFSELLLARRDLDSERSTEALGHIHESSRRLGRLIDDLLSVSRIESGSLGAEVRKVDLRQVVDAAMVTSDQSDACRLERDIPEALPAVVADPDQLVQVLTNLVSNALKYSPSDSAVRISARSVDDQVHVSVADRGIGMTPVEAAGVFGKFSRVDRPEVRQVSGTGLGLYITKRLVEMMGGRIWLTSKEGKGSIFTFSLRTAPSDPEDVDARVQVYAQAVDR